MRLFVLFSLVAACGQTPSNMGSDVDASTDASTASSDATGVAMCSDLAMQPIDSSWTVRSGDRDRIASVHVPASYDPTLPTPIVLNFHGYSSNAGQQSGLSRMNAKSDAEGFIAVHANGTGVIQGWNGGVCCGTAASGNVDDVQFVSDLLDELGRRLCVDPARVYSTGLSNGGFLSHRLACELSDRIAAIAPVAGVLGVSCDADRPVPVMHFHGTADTVVPFNGSVGLGFGAVDETIDTWSTINGCSGDEVTYDQGDTTCVSGTGCAEDSTVTLCTITGGGHTWPGGVPIPGAGTTSTDISATDAMWDFFSAHPHPNR